ncbi:MAG TPA: hypothetical protein PLQ64_03430 [Thiobacillaceae bacterium]|jgi:hypothetical protein|nr:hypothetical protein [Thiobacillaceae bacterium]HNA81496.1 hypothetical protein [Thiobacillaceae bacterium]HNH89606.1 hypothetical protein [Thiobacillaceae bacterium]HNI06660.1 hypothetical protein [Thiobacillaceae bacterium]
MFEKTIDYARESLIAASEAAVDRAGDRLSQVVDNASQAIDEKLDKISQELHSQRSMTKDDVREMVDYAAERLTVVLDDRITAMRREIAGLVEEKTEYFKAEIDAFFIKRQQDLARERRRLILNILLASGAALAVGAVSLLYKGMRDWDLLTVFRVVLASLSGGYAVWLVLSLLRGWLRMTEHKKDMVFLAARYWGWLRPASVFSTLLILAFLGVLSLVLMFPDEVLRLIGQPIFKPGG